MKTKLSILKTGVAVAFAAIVGVGCGNKPEPGDTGTADAIAEDPEVTNLSEPRPAPIGDTAVTGEQADQFGNLPPNVDTAARQMEKLDKQKEREGGQQQ
ncbi:hypothetical protein H7F15_02855 [Pontibacter sp. Tf4]|uniref:hypothetical protein n=1 Tax=Pontibacter sp. Tf4 TaxID=2761620 RepID=UPI0016234C64|nr:hypothetical protein [Pontibacter sp. Tf4]MBB6609965.1 hypothetical protein [Pontibacter sp. Tf4]